LIHEALAIIVDTANSPRIAGHSHDLAQYVIKLDHHPNLDQFGDLQIVEPTAAATSQLVYNFVESCNLKINDEIAKLLYCGIFSDTGGFIFPNTSTATFAVITKLVTYQFDREFINLELNSYDYQFVRLLSYVMLNLTIEGNFGYFIITREIQKDFQLTPQEASRIVNSLGMIKQLKA